MNDIIHFPATIVQVKTMADGGLRITLDLPEDAIPQGAMLMETRRQGIAIIVEIRADKSQ